MVLRANIFVGIRRMLFAAQRHELLATMASDVGDTALPSRRDALVSEYAEVCALLRLARRRQRRIDAAWVLTEGIRSVVVMIYVMSQYSVEPAIQFLLACGRERHWAPLDETSLRRLVEDVFMSFDEDAIASMTCLNHPVDHCAMKTAIRYLREWHVVQHARRVNSEKGVAPSSAWMLERAEEFRLALPADRQPRSLGTLLIPSGRRWMQRLRVSWGGRMRKIPPATPLTTTEFAEKAYRVCNSWESNAYVFG